MDDECKITFIYDYIFLNYEYTAYRENEKKIKHFNYLYLVYIYYI